MKPLRNGKEIKMEFDTALPIYIQIIEGIKRQIASGERAPGSRVESVRELAQKMGVNPNTGQRAFAELEREGLMYTERTSGRYITADTERIARLRKELAGDMIMEFVERMLRSGFTDDEIIALVKDYMEGKKHE
jgi:GntR family transcriptional regulator